MNKQPTELILHQLFQLDITDIHKFCKIDKRIARICINNKDYIVKNFLNKIGNPYIYWY